MPSIYCAPWSCAVVSCIVRKLPSASFIEIILIFLLLLLFWKKIFYPKSRRVAVFAGIQSQSTIIGAFVIRHNPSASGVLKNVSCIVKFGLFDFEFIAFLELVLFLSIINQFSVLAWGLQYLVNFSVTQSIEIRNKQYGVVKTENELYSHVRLCNLLNILRFCYPTQSCQIRSWLRDLDDSDENYFIKRITKKKKKKKK